MAQLSCTGLCGNQGRQDGQQKAGASNRIPPINTQRAHHHRLRSAAGRSGVCLKAAALTRVVVHSVTSCYDSMCSMFVQQRLLICLDLQPRFLAQHRFESFVHGNGMHGAEGLGRL